MLSAGLWLVKTSRPPRVTWRKTEACARRSRYQNGIEERARNQATPPTAKATRLKRITAQPTTRWTSGISPAPARGAKRGPYPPKRVGIRLADAEKHYVASCHKVGV